MTTLQLSTRTRLTNKLLKSHLPVLVNTRLLPSRIELNRHSLEDILRANTGPANNYAGIENKYV